MNNQKKQPHPTKANKVKYTGKKEPGILKWALIAILVFTALLYIRALHNGFSGWDDDDYLKLNPFLRNFNLKGIGAIFSSFYFANYHPLTTLTYLFEYTLFGFKPLPYHVLNVALHIVNVWLVYKLAEKLGTGKTAALIVALLFAIHPMHVESVAWISERKDVLYACFFLLSLIVYLKYLDSGLKTKLYCGVLLLFVASLMSKSVAVTLPVLLVAIDIYKGRKMDARFFVEKIPFFALSILFGILAILSQQALGLKNVLNYSYGFVDKIFLLSYTISFYIIKFFIPFNLSALNYLPNNNGGALPWQYYASLPFLLVLAWLILRKTIFRKEMIFGIFFFLITVSIMLQIVQVGNAITADRYSYVPFIGLSFIVGKWITDIGTKLKRGNTVLLLFALIVLIFSLQTWDRIAVWKDGEALFSDAIKKDPTVFLGYWNRGTFRQSTGNAEGALQDYNIVAKLKPNYADVYNSRGNTFNILGDPQSAIRDLDKFIKLVPWKAEAYYNRANYYSAAGDTKSAFHDYNRAIFLDPEFSECYTNRSILYEKTGDLKKAIADIDKIISFKPADADAYYQRGYLKALQKDFTGSVADFTYSIKLKDNDYTVYYNRGLSRLNLKDTNGACQDWEKASALGYAAAGQMIQQYCR